MQTKINKILHYTSKSDFAKYLEISRKCLYNRLEDGKWKQYQIDRINYLYELMTKNERFILGVSINNFTITIRMNEHKIYRTENYNINSTPSKS